MISAMDPVYKAPLSLFAFFLPQHVACMVRRALL